MNKKLKVRILMSKLIDKVLNWTNNKYKQINVWELKKKTIWLMVNQVILWQLVIIRTKKKKN